MPDATPTDAGAGMEKVTSADGTEIAFERTGSGPPLVLVPGGGANDHIRWEAGGVRPAFAEHCTTYAIDGRGLGASGDADEYALEREFEDVAAVVDSIGDPVVLLGHSSGGLLALEAACRTDNLRGLVLYEPPLLFGENGPEVDGTLAEMEALVEAGRNEEVLDLFLREIADIPPAEIDALRDAPNWPSRVAGAHTLPRALRGVGEYEFDPDRFAALTVPTLLLEGTESPPHHRDATVALEAALPNSRVVTFEGHGHVAMLTATDRFVDEVLAFVEETA